eukprot:jgi/Mesen1/6959/ME000360S06232
MWPADKPGRGKSKGGDGPPSTPPPTAPSRSAVFQLLAETEGEEEEGEGERRWPAALAGARWRGEVERRAWEQRPALSAALLQPASGRGGLSLDCAEAWGNAHLRVAGATVWLAGSPPGARANGVSGSALGASEMLLEPLGLRLCTSLYRSQVTSLFTSGAQVSAACLLEVPAVSLCISPRAVAGASQVYEGLLAAYSQLELPPAKAGGAPTPALSPPKPAEAATGSGSASAAVGPQPPSPPKAAGAAAAGVALAPETAPAAETWRGEVERRAWEQRPALSAALLQPASGRGGLSLDCAEAWGNAHLRVAGATVWLAGSPPGARANGVSGSALGASEMLLEPLGLRLCTSLYRSQVTSLFTSGAQVSAACLLEVPAVSLCISPRAVAGASQVYEGLLAAYSQLELPPAKAGGAPTPALSPPKPAEAATGSGSASAAVGPQPPSPPKAAGAAAAGVALAPETAPAAETSPELDAFTLSLALKLDRLQVLLHQLPARARAGDGGGGGDAPAGSPRAAAGPSDRWHAEEHLDAHVAGGGGDGVGDGVDPFFGTDVDPSVDPGVDIGVDFGAGHGLKPRREPRGRRKAQKGLAGEEEAVLLLQGLSSDLLLGDTSPLQFSAALKQTKVAVGLPPLSGPGHRVAAAAGGVGDELAAITEEERARAVLAVGECSARLKVHPLVPAGALERLQLDGGGGDGSNDDGGEERAAAARAGSNNWAALAVYVGRLTAAGGSLASLAEKVEERMRGADALEVFLSVEESLTAVKMATKVRKCLLRVGRVPPRACCLLSAACCVAACGRAGCWVLGAGRRVCGSLLKSCTCLCSVG